MPGLDGLDVIAIPFGMVTRAQQTVAAVDLDYRASRDAVDVGETGNHPLGVLRVGLGGGRAADDADEALGAEAEPDPIGIDILGEPRPREESGRRVVVHARLITAVVNQVLGDTVDTKIFRVVRMERLGIKKDVIAIIRAVRQGRIQ